MSRALDYQAMSSIKGAGGAPWVFGAFQPFVPESDRFAPIVNFFQTNNIFVADQLNVQFQTIDDRQLGLQRVDQHRRGAGRHQPQSRRLVAQRLTALK